MQKRDGVSPKGFTLRRPAASITTTSPGCTSRTNSAPTMSSAQVSDARIQPSPVRPSTSGRTPRGSRAPISAPLCSATSE